MKSRPRVWAAAYVLVVVGFLAAVARYYHPPYAFTALIDFTTDGHSWETPAVQNTPHYHYPPPGGYDGVFYAQLAVDPLLKDPAIDYAMDNAPYRARRILLSAIAWAFGLGRPAWILQAYALQNVIAWIVLAWLLCRWIPPTGPRALVLWSGCLLSHGMLSSVRYSLADGPSALIVALAVVAAEQKKPLLSSAIVGIGGLARETNLLAASLVTRWFRASSSADRGRGRQWLLIILCVLICLLPFALWLDYLRSIYRSLAFGTAGQITTPFSGLFWKIGWVVADMGNRGPTFATLSSVAALLAFLTQCGWLLWAFFARRDRSSWITVAGSFMVLGLVMHRVVWDGSPGAFTRVLLPMTIGTNVLLATHPRPPWVMIVAANLSVVPGIMLLGWEWA